MANPIVSRAELAIGGNPMTVKGVIQKTSLLLGLSALLVWAFSFMRLWQVYRKVLLRWQPLVA